MLALVLSVAWWVDELTRPEMKKRQVTRESPDSYAFNLLVKQYDVSGRLLQTLQTREMTHFEKRGITELTRPVVWRFTPDAPPWKMQAERGVAHHDDELLYLPGRVVIVRDGKGEFEPYQIVTENLTLHTDNSYAETSEAVNIRSGQQRLSAIGMQAWFSEPSRLKFLHQVRGHYEVE
jgi:lipopolysaccharide export system protein LptC